ncbi:hypothetical protein [Streptomyces phaeochromogenes]|uniref:hypothetical protein n=1 Tax=Streptomyces phaeochromogenes TaxID=1923 RepID=UPI0037100703
MAQTWGPRSRWSRPARCGYRAQWADVQEQFVESPQKAVTEADALLAGLARDRGFPDGEQFEEQFAALSVYHACRVPEVTYSI